MRLDFVQKIQMSYFLALLCIFCLSRTAGFTSMCKCQHCLSKKNSLSCKLYASQRSNIWRMMRSAVIWQVYAIYQALRYRTLNKDEKGYDNLYVPWYSTMNFATYQAKWQNTAKSFLMMCEYFDAIAKASRSQIQPGHEWSQGTVYRDGIF